MSPQDIDKLLKHLSECPVHEHSQIDESQTSRIAALIGIPPREQASGLRAIMADCCNGGLASDFAMLAMARLYEAILRCDQPDQPDSI